jgi:signal transduction histidine kinase
VPAPRAFTERRSHARRRADADLATEVGFLARSLDVLAGVGSAEERLAGLLTLIAQTAGAERAAVLADRGERRVAASVRSGDDRQAAEALAAWLDARAPRSRAERAAAAPALISLAQAAGSTDRTEDAVTTDTAEAPLTGDAATPEPGAATDDGRFRCVSIPSSATVVLGFDFGAGATADGWEARFPAAFARHAGAAIALIADELAAERELAMLRAQDLERTRFVSTVAHELRTPLTGLNGYVELILSGNVADPGVEREFLERSRDIVTSMDELVADLLELSRLESGSLRLEVDTFSVAEVGQRVLDHLAPIALQRTVELTATLPPRLRAARGDRRRVEQILKNLIGNALKFTPAGGSVELAGWFDGPVAILAVRDDGLGIAAEDRVRIFERFYRMVSHERVNGTGLGLPIARELARAMSGDLDVASVQRSGSSFVLVLPGPRAVDATAISGALQRALEAEEQRLEDRGMLRRLQHLDREAAAQRSGPVDDAAGVSRAAMRGGLRGLPARPGAARTGAEPAVHLRVLGSNSTAS